MSIALAGTFIVAVGNLVFLVALWMVDLSGAARSRRAKGAPEDTRDPR